MLPDWARPLDCGQQRGWAHPEPVGKPGFSVAAATNYQHTKGTADFEKLGTVPASFAPHGKAACLAKRTVMSRAVRARGSRN